MKESGFLPGGVRSLCVRATQLMSKPVLLRGVLVQSRQTKLCLTFRVLHAEIKKREHERGNPRGTAVPSEAPHKFLLNFNCS